MEFRRNAEAMASILHKLSRLPEAQTQPSIYKVHKHLRNINDKAYEPEVIAIGPYHHGKDSLKMMEEHKSRYLESLLQRRNQNVVSYISAVGELEQQARSCYAESVSLNSAKFIEMLVLDGCFIIEFLLRYIVGDSTSNDPIFQIRWIINCLKRDLILFENQIPFFVLCKLFDQIVEPNQHDTLISSLVLFFGNSLDPRAEYENRTNRSSQEVKHILDLIHSNWCPQYHAASHNMEREFLLIHSATDLTDANVKFQMRRSDSLFDVDFDKGCMLMPPLLIGDRTECFFRNLIAYEQYFPHDQSTFVTDYVRLLDCLINSSRDVEILSKCGIIENWLGDSETVANMFNQITDSVTVGQHFVYAETFGRVNIHYKKRWNRAMAILNRDYFASPWAYVSFFAALVLLVLTAAQTVFSALQVI